MSHGIENGVPSMTLRDVFYVLFRRKRLIAMFFVSAVLAAVVYTLLSSPAYKSTAKLMVRIGRENVILDPTAMGKTMNVAQTMQQQVKSELEILNSELLAEQVVDSIGAKNIMEPPNEPKPGGPSSVDAVRGSLKDVAKTLGGYVESLKEKLGVLLGDLTLRQRATLKVMKNLDVDGLYESNVMVAAVRAETRQMAQGILEELLKFYLAKHGDVYQTSGSYDFFQSQAQKLKGSIAEKDARLQRMKNSSKMLSLDIQQSSVAGRISALQTAVQETRTALVIARAKLSTITAMRNQTASPNARWEAHKLVGDETELAQRNEIALHQATLETYEKELAAVQQDRERVTDVGGKLQQLEQELAIDRAAYQRYQESLEQSRIDEALEVEQISNIAIVQPPTYPLEKDSPLGMLNLFLGVAVGLMGGVALAFVVEHIDTSVRRPEDVEGELSLTTLAALPRVRPSRLRGPQAGADVKANVPPNFLQPLRVLRDRLSLMSEIHASKPKLIGVTSTYPREGVSTICSHLATLLAQEGRDNVLLVDANLPDPSAHETFHTPLQPGLREMLGNGSGPLTAIHETVVPRLHLLPAGEMNGGEPSYEGGRMASMLDQWKQAYGFVILDMPCFGTPSFSRLANLMDGVVLVVEAERVRRHVVGRVKDQLVEANANLLGVVLNKRRFPIPNWLYRRL